MKTLVIIPAYNEQAAIKEICIKKLSIDDGEDIYQMLQIIKANENGFLNLANGKNYDEYKNWLVGEMNRSLQDGIINGSLAPQTTYWLYENDQPVGYGKIRHFLTDKLLISGGNVGYALIPSARNRGLGKKFLKLLIVAYKKHLTRVNKRNSHSKCKATILLL